jgi:hypothetical protein
MPLDLDRRDELVEINVQHPIGLVPRTHERHATSICGSPPLSSRRREGFPERQAAVTREHAERQEWTIAGKAEDMDVSASTVPPFRTRFRARIGREG